MSQAVCDFFGCVRLPFDKSVPVRDLFPSTAHQEVQARLAFALTQRYPAMITGDVGSGKSTAVRAFIHSLDTNLHLVAYLPNPNLTVQAFFAQMLSAFRVSPTFHPRGLGERLRDTLADLSQRGCRPLVVVDEAHLLSHRLLHELRYDPFDLSSLEIWFKGQFLAQAQPVHLQTGVQPGLTPEPVPPPPPRTGLDYLAMLRQERERLLRDQLPPIPFTRLNPNSTERDDHVSSSL